MMRTLGVLAAILVVAPRADADAWASFRGPRATGVAEEQSLPASWDVRTGQNIRFKTKVPGLGHSSPVVFGDRLFLTTAVGGHNESLTLGDEGGIALVDDAQPLSWRLYCLDSRDGRVLWQAEAYAGPPPAKRHVKSSQANATPATDGKTIVAVFPGGLVAFDWNGRTLWKSDLGRLNPGLLGDATSEWGHGSSPVIADGRVFVQVDRHVDSFLAAYDLASGKRLWQVARAERPVWATPLLHNAAGRQELVVVGGHYVRAYDPLDGRELWRFRDEAEVKTPSPFASDGLIVFSGGYRGRPLYAIRSGASGDVSVPEGAASGPYLAWRTEPGGPYTVTPLAYRGRLYAVRDEGIFMAYDLRTGGLHYRERTGTTHSASPVASDGRVYLAAEGGEVLVLAAGERFEILARNDMGEPVFATPAIANRTLYVRTRGHLYAIGTTDARRAANPWLGHRPDRVPRAAFRSGRISGRP
jgi:outer membrane protein assembly factor BamB